jgi:hypothetical protein
MLLSMKISVPWNTVSAQIKTLHTKKTVSQNGAGAPIFATMHNSSHMLARKRKLRGGGGGGGAESHLGTQPVLVERLNFFGFFFLLGLD